MKIIEYATVEEEDRALFESEVNKLITEGWQPLGGMCIQDIWYVQAMVKYEIPVVECMTLDVIKIYLQELQNHLIHMSDQLTDIISNTNQFQR